LKPYPKLEEVFDTLKEKPKILRVEDIEEKSAEWLVDDLIPKGQITSLVGSGGVGKTHMLCYIVSCITNGIPFYTEGTEEKEPQTVLYLSAEDSFSVTLKPRLRKMGADLSKVYTVDITDPTFSELTLTSPTLDDLIKEIKPALMILDPIQSFIDSNVKLSERNGVRRCVQTLIGYGSEYGTTTILVVHTNKRSLAHGRDRMADSADLWDVSRSVLMIGKTTEDNVRYMSHEKCNYGMLQQTVLFSIHKDSIDFVGRSDKRDEDFVYMQGKKREKPTPARDDAKEYILQSIGENRVQIGELKKRAKTNGISEHTFERAVKDLEEENIVKRVQVSRGGQSKGFDWYLMYDIGNMAENSSDD
jgi:RecA-family ATPase